MRAVSICLILTATIASGQTLTRDETISRMTFDLLPLKDAVTSPDALKENYSRDELRSLVTVSQNRVIVAWQKDVLQFQSRLNRPQANRRPEGTRVIGFASFSSPAQVYQLTWVLADKDLSEENVRPLAEAVVELIESGVSSRETSAPLEESGRFRAAAEKAWNTLLALGVSSKDVHIVTKALFEGAMRMALPPMRITYK